MSYKKWEYYILKDIDVDKLNLLGDQGWEIASSLSGLIIFNGKPRIVLIKRVIFLRAAETPSKAQ